MRRFWIWTKRNRQNSFLTALPKDELFVAAKELQAPYELVAEIAETVGRTPDATRQLASQARRRIRERRARAASREAHDAVARAFAEATATGDLAALIGVLDPDVVLRADGAPALARRR